MTDQMILSVICEDCKEVFTIGNKSSDELVELKREEFNLDIGGRAKPVMLCYYDCPKCLRRHFVQIDDDVTESLKKDCERQFILLSARRSHKKPAKQQSINYKHSSNILQQERLKLMKRYSGSTVYNNKGFSFILTFSV